MAFKKRESAAIAAAQTRSAGLKAIQPDGKLDLGNGVTHEAFEAEIADANQALTDYNAALSVADKFGNILEAKEKKLNQASSKVLTAVGLKYGKDSDPYEQAGGTRESERKHPAHKPKGTPKG